MQAGVFNVTNHYEQSILRAGDAGFAPMSSAHYFKNIGTTDCYVVLIFNAGTFTNIDATFLIGNMPAEVSHDRCSELISTILQYRYWSIMVYHGRCLLFEGYPRNCWVVGHQLSWVLPLYQLLRRVSCCPCSWLSSELWLGSSSCKHSGTSLSLFCPLCRRWRQTWASLWMWPRL